MSKLLCLLLMLWSVNASFAQPSKLTIISNDIDNFWVAYDNINATGDSLKQQAFLKELYIDKGTEGLKGLIEARNYTETDFLYWTTKYPKFWRSLRNNQDKVAAKIPAIHANIQKLEKAYPNLKPATMYFSIGAFRTNGTIQGRNILIGSEFMFADKTTVIDEFPDWRQTYYKNQDPVNELPLHCTHEFIHTQQKEMVDNLLSICLYEGVAEFVSCKVTETKSNSPAIAFGKANQKLVIDRFVQEVFTPSNLNNWVWGENQNELKVRDLGYYVGYELCERYYNLSKDKQQAIKELIELDYTDEKEVERIVDLTRLFPKSLEALYYDYEKQRPTVVSIQPFENGSQKVKPGIIRLSITFSEEMDTRYRGFDYGPLGEGHVYTFKSLIGWSNNNKTISLEVEVEPNKQYQTLITNSFRNKNGLGLKPFLIDFKTTE